MRRLPLWGVTFLLLVSGATAEPPATRPAPLEVRQENDRLRRENAALKKQVADLTAQVEKLTADLAAAATPGKPIPKATKQSPASILKLIPADCLPDGGHWEEAKRIKARKVLIAHLGDEWIQLTLTFTEAPKNNERPWVMNTAVDGGILRLVVYCRFPEGRPSRGAPRDGGTATVVGKVNPNVYLHDEQLPGVVIDLSECRLVLP